MFLSSRKDGWSSRKQSQKAFAGGGGGGGGRGMLTRKILKILASNGCTWCIFEVNSAPIR